jgi:hypothetical protein
LNAVAGTVRNAMQARPVGIERIADKSKTFGHVEERLKII